MHIFHVEGFFFLSLPSTCIILELKMLKVNRQHMITTDNVMRTDKKWI